RDRHRTVYGYGRTFTVLIRCQPHRSRTVPVARQPGTATVRVRYGRIRVRHPPLPASSPAVRNPPPRPPTCAPDVPRTARRRRRRVSAACACAARTVRRAPPLPSAHMRACCAARRAPAPPCFRRLRRACCAARRRPPVSFVRGRRARTATRGARVWRVRVWCAWALREAQGRAGHGFDGRGRGQGRGFGGHGQGPAISPEPQSVDAEACRPVPAVYAVPYLGCQMAVRYGYGSTVP
ncbi:hypothetical protein GGX14DRAFT_586701, partial [Mycena pura]